MGAFGFREDYEGEMVKVVFLDIDGVLVTARTLKERSGRYKVADTKCIYALNHLTTITEASIVISSSWRFCGANEMRAIFNLWGVYAPIVGITIDLTRKDGETYIPVPRGLEIQEWLDAHPEVESFVILDDECDMAHLESFMVKTKFDCGLTEQDAHKAIEILSGRVLEGKQ